MSITLAAALAFARDILRHGDTDTVDLDARVLLMSVLQVSAAALWAGTSEALTDTQWLAYQALIQRRSQGEPVAYLIGQREFWSHTFSVTPAVLIPRPETELLVERILQEYAETVSPFRIVDLGTGCGAIAISLAKSHPEWEVHATDISQAALQVAAANAEQLAAPVIFHQGSWFSALPSSSMFHVIVSNPPYIAWAEKKYLMTVRYEPEKALFADAEGLSAVTEIITGAKDRLMPQGHLLLEHGSTQAASVRKLLAAAGYQAIKTYCDLAGLDRVTEGKVPGSFS